MTTLTKSVPRTEVLLDNEPLETNFVDEADSDDTVTPERYDITSFGADYDVEGLVRRLQRGDIFIPSFQRNYVWNQNLASRFIESLLLGLPVPGIFLAREADSNKLFVIDGQQRLKTLQFFYDGFFKPEDQNDVRRVFKLLKVQPQFEGCTYNSLNNTDRLRLDDSILHATVIRQVSPDDNDTSLYHVFQRLNSGSVTLAPQEMRTAVYHGDLIDLVKKLNENEYWRSMFGPHNARLKDQEFVLRFLALYFNGNEYQRPIGEFLTQFTKRNQKASPNFLAKAEKTFLDTIRLVQESLGNKAFRPDRVLNAALFDSVMVGLARRNEQYPVTDYAEVKEAYSELLSDRGFSDLISQHTSDESNVRKRLQQATSAFAKV